VPGVGLQESFLRKVKRFFNTLWVPRFQKRVSKGEIGSWVS
jgi:hypothetical protein